MEYQKITGDWGERNLDFGEAVISARELLRLLQAWRENLGEKRGLLDQYLAGVLTAMTDTTNARDTAEAGYDEAFSVLRRILRHIKEGTESEVQTHPFYSQVKAYADAHSFPRDPLYYETYCAALFPQYLSFAIKDYLEYCNADFKERLEAYNIPQIRSALLSSAADITAEGLDYLHNLIARVFVFIAPSSIFVQGMADQLLCSLISKNKETGGYVFNRLIDGTVAYE